MLGGESPPPLKSNSLMQSVPWDGRDDQGKLLTPIQDYHARLRAGMYPVLDSIVGGDPYSFFSCEMGQGDHATWAITGLEEKPDGSVYVLGMAVILGQPCYAATILQATITVLYCRHL
jgi:hypothetical protein